MNENIENIATWANDQKIDLERMSINDNDMETNLDDIVTAIYWSSGTTEHPRGIPHNHRTKLTSYLQIYNFKNI